MQSIQRLAATVAAFLAASGSALAQGHTDFCDPSRTASPVLSTSDFDGDGKVSAADAQALAELLAGQQYVALFDRNADGALDQADMALARAEIGAASSVLDRELAAAYQGTKAYRDVNAAKAAGYIPFTETFYGHGSHWMQRPEQGKLDYTFDAGAPEGLNYNADGRLWAVFYYAGPSPVRLDGTRYRPGHAFRPFAPPPEGFCGEADVWHHHAAACIKGLNYDQPAMDPARLTFREGLSPRQCLPGCATARGLPASANARWTPEFHMLHAWIYVLNPCGTFAGAHPGMAKGSLHPAASQPIGHFHSWDTHPAYPFAGGMLCAWLSELGQVPAFCASRH